ncbi:MAG TPA: hypothetical protein VLK35_06135 [Methylomirabilota bacterium]|jgi:hypothetical protein|nr:hypothetical protein [Methylomirabilota bacterium]
MKYLHRTPLPPAEALAEAARWFGARLAPAGEAPHQRRFSGSLGAVTVDVRAEGGHFTQVTVATDQVGESELDKLAKRFLATLHARTEPGYAVRGAY